MACRLHKWLFKNHTSCFKNQTFSVFFKTGTFFCFFCFLCRYLPVIFINRSGLAHRCSTQVKLNYRCHTTSIDSSTSSITRLRILQTNKYTWFQAPLLLSLSGLGFWVELSFSGHLQEPKWIQISYDSSYSPRLQCRDSYRSLSPLSSLFPVRTVHLF